MDSIKLEDNSNEDIKKGDLDHSTLSNKSLQFEPIVYLPEIEIFTNEEDEEEIIKLRAKLYRFDNDEEAEWKERGTGNVKILRHKSKNTCRIVMRREKTYKVCANHFILPTMKLLPCFKSERAWLWTTPVDFADETPKPECLAIKFVNSEFAKIWKEKFEFAQEIVAGNSMFDDELVSNDDVNKNSNERKELLHPLPLTPNLTPNKKNELEKENDLKTEIDDNNSLCEKENQKDENSEIISKIVDLNLNKTDNFITPKKENDEDRKEIIIDKENLKEEN